MAGVQNSQALISVQDNQRIKNKRMAFKRLRYWNSTLSEKYK